MVSDFFRVAKKDERPEVSDKNTVKMELFEVDKFVCFQQLLLLEVVDFVSFTENVRPNSQTVEAFF